MHCIISLPAGDAKFDVRTRLIESLFSKEIPKTEWLSETRLKRGERGIWQKCYGENLIRDEQDVSAHMDYVRINPRCNTRPYCSLKLTGLAPN